MWDLTLEDRAILALLSLKRNPAYVSVTAMIATMDAHDVDADRMLTLETNRTMDNYYRSQTA